MRELIKYGLLINDVVDMAKIYCWNCARPRWHEQYDAYRLCIACCEIKQRTETGEYA